jgi:hypothetical protein
MREFGAQTHEQNFAKFYPKYILPSRALVRADFGDCTSNQPPKPPLGGAGSKSLGIFDQNKPPEPNFAFWMQTGLGCKPVFGL